MRREAFVAVAISTCCCACGSAGEHGGSGSAKPTVPAGTTTYYVPIKKPGPFARDTDLPPIEVTGTLARSPGIVSAGPVARGAPVTMHGPIAVSGARFRTMMKPVPTVKSMYDWQSKRLNKPNGDGLAYQANCNCDPQFAVSLVNGLGICSGSGNMVVYDRSLSPLYIWPSTAGNPLKTFWTPLASVLPDAKYQDPRLLFDEIRQRFWVTTMLNPKSSGTPKLFIAVSQSDDAMGGWNYYWTQGNGPNCTSCSIDYDQIGISEDRFLLTVKAFDDQRQNYAHVFNMDAWAAASGGQMSGWQWYTLTNPDGSKIDTHTAPVRVHPHDSSDTAAYFVGHYAGNKLLVWTLPDGQNNPGYMYSTQYNLGSAYNAYGAVPPMYQDGITTHQLRTDTPAQGGSYAYRDGSLVVAWHERYSSSWDWPGIRLVGLDIPSHTTIFDERFGYAFSDASFAYPAVDINAYDDEIGLAFSATGSYTYPAIYYGGISPSGTSTGFYIGWTGSGYFTKCQQGSHNGLAWSDIATMEADPIGGHYSSFWTTNEYGQGWGATHFQMAVVNFATNY